MIVLASPNTKYLRLPSLCQNEGVTITEEGTKKEICPEEFIDADCPNRTSDLRITSATRYPCAKPALSGTDKRVLERVNMYKLQIARKV